MTDPDEAIEEFLRKADAAYTGMTEFSLRVEQVSISGIREVFEAAGAGIEAVIQPGGSVNDEDVIDAADDHDMAMAFTGQRVLNTDTGRRAVFR